MISDNRLRMNCCGRLFSFIFAREIGLLQQMHHTCVYLFIYFMFKFIFLFFIYLFLGLGGWVGGGGGGEWGWGGEEENRGLLN